MTAICLVYYGQERNESKVRLNVSMVRCEKGIGMGRLNATEMVARIWILTQSNDSSEYAGRLDQGRYGRVNAREMLARPWIKAK